MSKKNVFMILSASFISSLILYFGLVYKPLPKPIFNEYPTYNFIDYKQNKIIFTGDSSKFEAFYQKLSVLINKGEGKINVLQIGDSHIQADLFSGRMRSRLQTFEQGLNGGRGFVFPYKAAKTNSPWTYINRFTGEWIPCRNVELKKDCILGLSGISVTTHKPGASITIFSRDVLKYDFNRFKVYCETDSSCFDIRMADTTIIKKITRVDSLGYIEFQLKKYIDTLDISFVRTNAKQNHFVLYGINLETDDPGIVYHSIGINGAEAGSYVRCQLFTEHLKSIKPDWVILSLGTNDVMGKVFREDEFRANYMVLLNRIKEVAPNAAVLITVPGDNYRYRRYPNQNTALIRNTMLQIAKENGCGVWSLYDVMGGLKSVDYWFKNGLTARDKLHFTRDGYYIQGDLLFRAFEDSYGNYLAKTVHK